MTYQSTALNTYRETGIKTASQGKLILMLYDEAIRQIAQAITVLGDGKFKASDIETVNTCIIKVQEIVTELMASLDLEKGGEIATNLLSIYSFFNQQLLQANIKKDSKILVDVKNMMQELRLAWQQVVLTNAKSENTEMQPSIDIAR